MVTFGIVIAIVLSWGTCFIFFFSTSHGEFIFWGKIVPILQMLKIYTIYYRKGCFKFSLNSEIMNRQWLWLCTKLIQQKTFSILSDNIICQQEAVYFNYIYFHYNMRSDQKVSETVAVATELKYTVKPLSLIDLELCCACIVNCNVHVCFHCL